MKAYIEDEGRLFAVSLAVTALSIAAIVSSPFIYNVPVVFYACVVLTIAAGLYLSRSISYAEEGRRAAGRPKGQSRGPSKGRRARAGTKSRPRG